ncbi:UDP-N-acetylmuramoyl-tripeptide--D-alanyl-D-alanine ligase [Tenacibaculum sp. UWU-22]|uniref:UDP-N-acetylmuramoyl-tripeptide--D-alanyl-D- alanine ligase n=1 Tax=Tenacibaculum sp. UWU-22 TaxID=3234187 RepID=UPI0034DB4F98
MNIADLYKLYKKNFLVDTDTRSIQKNTLFFALKGANFNGNKFAEEALKKGALYSIVDEKKYQTSDNIILVDNVLETLQQLALYHRQQLTIPIIALTGSNGKTTTKELINKVLSEGYKTTATQGNLNNHIGVPLTLLTITPETEIAIIEMGANHFKEIAFLCEIAQPDYGYITNFGKAHLEGFGSIEGVIQAKSELYDYLKINNKTAFVNTNDPIQVEKTKNSTRILFDKTITFLEVNPFVKLSFQDKIIQSNLIGKYNYPNMAAAITIGKYFKISAEKIKQAIESYTPDNNRSQIIKTKRNTIILDAYNANPTSMVAALENFNMVSSKNKTVILGDMFELGDTSLEEHQKIADLASSFNFNNLFFVGENFYKTKTEKHQFKTFDLLKKHLQLYPIENNLILIKGSRGMALERVLPQIS